MARGEIECLGSGRFGSHCTELHGDGSGEAVDCGVGKICVRIEFGMSISQLALLKHSRMAFLFKDYFHLSR